MTNQDAYYLGFEDGFADGVCMDTDMTAQQAYSYRKGFAAGTKARDEAGN